MFGDFIHGKTFSLPSRRMVQSLPKVILGLFILGVGVLLGASYEDYPVVRWSGGTILLALLFLLCFSGNPKNELAGEE